MAHDNIRSGDKPIICTVSYNLKSLSLLFCYKVIPTFSFCHAVSVSCCSLFLVISPLHHAFIVRYSILLTFHACISGMYNICILMWLLHRILIHQSLNLHESPVAMANLVFQEFTLLTNLSKGALEVFINFANTSNQNL